MIPCASQISDHISHPTHLSLSLIITEESSIIPELFFFYPNKAFILVPKFIEEHNFCPLHLVFEGHVMQEFGCLLKSIAELTCLYWDTLRPLVITDIP